MFIKNIFSLTVYTHTETKTYFRMYVSMCVCVCLCVYVWCYLKNESLVNTAFFFFFFIIIIISILIIILVILTIFTKVGYYRYVFLTVDWDIFYPFPFLFIWLRLFSSFFYIAFPSLPTNRRDSKHVWQSGFLNIFKTVSLVL